MSQPSLLQVEYDGIVVTEADLGDYIRSPALAGDMTFAHRLAWAVARRRRKGTPLLEQSQDTEQSTTTAELCDAMCECFARMYRCKTTLDVQKMSR